MKEHNNIMTHAATFLKFNGNSLLLNDISPKGK